MAFLPPCIVCASRLRVQTGAGEDADHADGEGVEGGEGDAAGAVEHVRVLGSARGDEDADARFSRKRIGRGSDGGGGGGSDGSGGGGVAEKPVVLQAADEGDGRRGQAAEMEGGGDDNAVRAGKRVADAGHGVAGAGVQDAEAGMRAEAAGGAGGDL